MSGGYISFFNASTVFSDAELQSALPDFQSQVSNEFNWYWGLNAYLDINGGGTPISIVDYPAAGDPQNALGYHSVDGNYQPYAVVFAGLCRDYGYPTTGVISHELLETMADQLTDTVDLYDFGDGTGVIVIQEVCDPCELNLYYEGPNGNIVSDFATPAWFAPGDPNQVDYLGVIPGPWQLVSGGYISYQSVTLSGWQQAFGDKAQQVLNKAADAIRTQNAAAGNPPLDMIRQLQLQRVQQGQPVSAGAQGQPVSAGAQRGQELGQTAAQRRQQPARQTGEITVVKRKDVPQIGDVLGRLVQLGASQVSQQVQQNEPAAGPAGQARVTNKRRTEPKAQTIPARS